jgi:hypothetical protein
VSAKAPLVATTLLLRELGIAHIMEATAARTRAFLYGLNLNIWRSDMVGQPSRRRHNTWTFPTVRWLDRFARASAELAQGILVPHAWKSLQSRYAYTLVKVGAHRRLIGDGPGGGCARRPVGIEKDTAVRSARSTVVRNTLYIGFFRNNLFTLPAPRSPARHVRYVFRGQILLDIVLLKGGGACISKGCAVRMARPDQRWDAGVGAGGGQPGINAMARRSLVVA